jgi:hypothetical protein
MLLQIERTGNLGMKDYQVEFRHFNGDSEFGRNKLGPANLKGITIASVAHEGRTAIGLALCGMAEHSYVKEKGRMAALRDALRRGPFKEDIQAILKAYHARPRAAVVAAPVDVKVSVAGSGFIEGGEGETVEGFIDA